MLSLQRSEQTGLKRLHTIFQIPFRLLWNQFTHWFRHTDLLFVIIYWLALHNVIVAVMVFDRTRTQLKTDYFPPYLNPQKVSQIFRFYHFGQMGIIFVYGVHKERPAG